LACFTRLSASAPCQSVFNFRILNFNINGGAKHLINDRPANVLTVLISQRDQVFSSIQIRLLRERLLHAHRALYLTSSTANILKITFNSLKFSFVEKKVEIMPIKVLVFRCRMTAAA